MIGGAIVAQMIGQFLHQEDHQDQGLRWTCPLLFAICRVPDADGRHHRVRLPAATTSRAGCCEQLGQPGDHRPIRGCWTLAARPEPSARVVTMLHVARVARCPSSEAEVADLRRDLMRAGFRSENALPVFYGAPHSEHAGDAGARPR